MALETCFRAWALHAPASSKDRLLVGAGGSSSSGSLVLPSRRAAVAAPLSVGRVASRRPRHICQSKNAVDEGIAYMFVGCRTSVRVCCVGLWLWLWLSPGRQQLASLQLMQKLLVMIIYVCAVLEADEKNWDGMVIACDTPVLVEFWAPWCGPCRMIAPVIDELAKDYAGKIKCCKVNTDDSPNVASTYGIRSIPTVLIFKGGEKKESVIGAVPKSTLTTLIDKYIGSS